MRYLLFCALAGCSCGGGSGADSGTDASVDAMLDVASDSAFDSASDGGFDSGVDRVDGPGDIEPDDTTLEPGTDADHVYRYCWHLSHIFCRGMHSCCDVPERLLGDDVDQCHAALSDGLCAIWIDRPDAAGPRDVEVLEANLQRLDEAADECGELAVKFVFAFGILEPGANCSSEAENPSFLCGEEAQCIDEVCTSYPEIGEPCFATSTNRCEPGEAYCVDDECVARETRDIGELCEDYGQCETFRCEEGMCVARAESPWCFSR